MLQEPPIDASTDTGPSGPSVISPAPGTGPSGKRRRGVAIAGVAIAVVAIGALVVGLTPGHFGLSVPLLNSSVGGTNDPQKTGCPSTSADVHWPKPANITVKISDTNSVTNAHVGDIIQIALPAGKYKWTLTSGGGSSLQSDSPAGYYDSSANTCVWRFTAQSAGTTIVKFQGPVLCQPNRACSPLILEAPFEMKIA
jgi:hypothetical protein